MTFNHPVKPPEVLLWGEAAPGQLVGTGTQSSEAAVCFPARWRARFRNDVWKERASRSGIEEEAPPAPFSGADRLMRGVSALRFIAPDMFVNIYYYLSLYAALTDRFFSLKMALDQKKNKKKHENINYQRKVQPSL